MLNNDLEVLIEILQSCLNILKPQGQRNNQSISVKVLAVTVIILEINGNSIL